MATAGFGVVGEGLGGVGVGFGGVGVGFGGGVVMVGFGGVGVAVGVGVLGLGLLVVVDGLDVALGRGRAGGLLPQRPSYRLAVWSPPGQ